MQNQTDYKNLLKKLKKKVKQKLTPKIKPKIIKPKKLKSITGKGVVFYNNPQELPKKVSSDSGRNGSR